MKTRPFQPSDRDAVNALHRSVWWPERSDAGWAWLDANPARLEIKAEAGWVVDAAPGPGESQRQDQSQGRAGAFVGNFIQRFWYGDQSHYGATGFSTIVPPTMRGASRSLFRTLLKQPGVFAGYTFNANNRSAPLYARHGMAAWPPRTHDLKLSWIIDPAVCLHSRLLREVVKRAPHLTDPYRERFMNLRLRDNRATGLPAGVTPLSDLHDESRFGDFWTALRHEGRLVADRSPEMLRWRLADPDRTIAPVLLAHERDGAITGYAMAVLAKATPIEPAVLEIIDLIALRDEPHAIPALMQALLAEAQGHGAAKARLQVLDEEMLRRLGPYAASARREGGWGHCHVAFAPDGPPHGAWSPTPFDGDHGICQRPVPIETGALADRDGVRAA